MGSLLTEIMVSSLFLGLLAREQEGTGREMKFKTASASVIQSTVLSHFLEGGKETASESRIFQTHLERLEQQCQCSVAQGSNMWALVGHC